MKEPSSEFQSLMLTQPLDYAVESDARDDEARWYDPLLLICRLFYAVLIVGFLGYFFDKTFNSYK